MKKLKRREFLKILALASARVFLGKGQPEPKPKPLVGTNAKVQFGVPDANGEVVEWYELQTPIEFRVPPDQEKDYFDISKYTDGSFSGSFTCRAIYNDEEDWSMYRLFKPEIMKGKVE
jgi:hypothetical protein